ncbi:hypothetical protein IWX46DRAFT_582654 [Phyllosticta citricarpa]|uniref:Uncharacterized protein n=1 Tax=Phyllosticta citricarpa TaxID=55181 RepID=A0ABR1LYS1_9PEZI
MTWHGEGGAAGLDISEGGGGGGSGSADDTSSLSFLVIIGSSEVQQQRCWPALERVTTDGRSANRWVHFQSGVGGEGGCGGGGGGGGGGVGLNSSDRRQTSNQMGGRQLLVINLFFSHLRVDPSAGADRNTGFMQCQPSVFVTCPSLVTVIFGFAHLRIAMRVACGKQDIFDVTRCRSAGRVGVKASRRLITKRPSYLHPHCGFDGAAGANVPQVQCRVTVLRESGQDCLFCCCATTQEKKDP